jgi:chaperonin GroEL
LQERLAKLAGGIAVINVGAATESEMKEKKDRFDDALHATRAAIEEGIVPGGGVALLRCSEALEKLSGVDADQQMGIDIVLRALEEPLRAIAANAGFEGAVVAGKVRDGKGAYGFNARTEVYEDLVKAGVIDPTKVVRSTIENAASIAALMLTTEALIAELPAKSAAPAMPPGGDMY